MTPHWTFISNDRLPVQLEPAATFLNQAVLDPTTTPYRKLRHL